MWRGLLLAFGYGFGERELIGGPRRPVVLVSACALLGLDQLGAPSLGLTQGPWRGRCARPVKDSHKNSRKDEMSEGHYHSFGKFWELTRHKRAVESTQLFTLAVDCIARESSGTSNERLRDAVGLIAWGSAPSRFCGVRSMERLWARWRWTLCQGKFGHVTVKRSETPSNFLP